MGNHEEIPVVEGYTPEKRTIGMLKANLLAVLLMVVVGALAFGAMRLLWGSAFLSYSATELLIYDLLFLVLLVVGIVVHELIHGLTWCILTKKGFRHLKFGLMKGGAYCHIDVPMSKRDYVIGALMPLVLVGLVPLAVALCTGSILWLLLGVLFIGGAMGDIMIVWSIRREAADTLVYDHPSEGGCYVYHKTQES